MLILYILLTTGVLGTAAALGYTAVKGTNKIAQLAAPPDEKHKKIINTMRESYKEMNELYAFIDGRFILDFNEDSYYGNDHIKDVIKAEMLKAKKQLVCANFIIGACNQHTEPAFCKKLVKDFNIHIANAKTILEKLSEIWTSTYK